MAAVNLVSNLESVANRFHQAGAQTQLVALHYSAQKIHKTSKMATPSAFFSQKMHEVLKQIRQLSKDDRQEVLAEILHGAHTRLAEAYDNLDTNMRMAFWYRLVNDYPGYRLLPTGRSYPASLELEALLSDLEVLDSNELIAFLRAAVEA